MNGLIYYPYLEFPSVAELKRRLLMAERVGRVVPEDYAPEDPPEVLEAIAAGAVHHVRPKPYWTDAAARFEQAWTRDAADRMRKRVDAECDQRPQGKVHSQIQLWRGKLPPSLARKFLEDGEATLNGDWYTMDGLQGGVYMTCLAASAAQQLGMTLTTDRDVLAASGRLFAAVQPAGDATRHAAGLSWAMMLVRLPAATSLGTVPMERVLRFREKHAGGVAAMWCELESIASDLAAAKGPEAFELCRMHHEKRILKLSEEHRVRLSELRVRTVTGLFKLDTPALVAGAAALYQPNPLTIGAALTLAVADWWLDTKALWKDATDGNPWHYLLKTQSLGA